jgi:hypothetical protein
VLSKRGQLRRCLVAVPGVARGRGLDARGEDLSADRGATGQQPADDDRPERVRHGVPDDRRPRAAIFVDGLSRAVRFTPMRLPSAWLEDSGSPFADVAAFHEAGHMVAAMLLGCEVRGADLGPLER